MEDVTRRNFLGAMGAMGLGATVAGLAEFSGAAEAQAAVANADEINPATGNGYTEALRAGIPGVKGSANNAYQGPANPLCTREEAVEWWHNQPMVTEDYVQPDGKVIPACYINLRNRWNRMGCGVGSDCEEGNGWWDWLMYMYSPQEAEWQCKMPMKEVFNAAEFALESGFPEYECEVMCENLCMKGVLIRINRGGVPHYSHSYIPFGHIQRWRDEEYRTTFGAMYSPMATPDLFNAGSKTYKVIPASVDVVPDCEVVSPFDDWKGIIMRQNKFVIDACNCKSGFAASIGDFRYENDINYRLPDGKNDRVNCCLAMGELAEYYIWAGIGREVTRDEAMANVQQSMDDGMVIQHFYSNDTEVICQCRCDHCSILTPQKALHGVGDSMYAASNYILELNKDTCIQCGACIERCPLEAITFGDDGFPQMATECAVCGQCAYICPAGARQLTPKPIEEQLDMPSSVGADWFEKAIYRRMNGTLWDFLPGMESNKLGEPNIDMSNMGVNPFSN